MFALVPPWSALAMGAYGGAGSALGAAAVGAALLLWGRYAGRFVFAAIGAAAGWWAGPFVADAVRVDALAGRISLAVAGCILGALATPLLWALTAGAALAGVALYFGVLQNQPDLVDKAPAFVVKDGDFDLVGYCTAWAAHLMGCFSSAWKTQSEKMALLAGLAGGPPIIVGVIRLRLATIIMSALCGAAAIVSGLSIAVALLIPSAAAPLREHWFVPAGAGAVLAAVGVLVQYRRALKAEKNQDKREGGPPAPKAGAKATA